MRGSASVLTVAFVFASASLLVGQAAGQSETSTYTSDPSYPEYRQPAPDAFVQGIVSGPKGPVAGASVSTSSYASPPEPTPLPAEDGSNSSGGSKIACYDCYYGGYNSTVTDENGHYFLGVWRGETQLSVYHNDFVGHSETFSVAAGQNLTHDVVLKAYPEKTAHIVGKVTDAKTGKGLPFANVNVRSPQFGPSECSQPEGTASGSTGGSSGMAESSLVYPGYYGGCRITIHGDGSFEGDVTPGYSILSVYAYQDCSTTRDADGGGSTTCGPEYLAYSRTLTLPANETTRIDIALQSRPSPDATVSGYLVDAETGQAIPGAQVSFSSQETYGYGYATTDGDGSYKLRLRSGYHTVSAYANGHLAWEGVLQVKAGSSDFDVQLTPGQEQYGGGYCCYDALAAKSSAATGTYASLPPGGGAAGMAEGDASADGGSSQAYEDLGGGLGPYDPAKRSQATANADGEVEPSGGDKGLPGPGLLLALAALGAVLVLRRRAA